MNQFRCQNIVNGKVCNRRLCDIIESINATIAVQSNSKKKKTDIELPCPKCGALNSIRLPRGANPEIKFAPGIRPQQ